jgi:hypothetical protein
MLKYCHILISDANNGFNDVSMQVYKCILEKATSSKTKQDKLNEKSTNCNVNQFNQFYIFSGFSDLKR